MCFLDAENSGEFIVRGNPESRVKEKDVICPPAAMEMGNVHCEDCLM